MGKRETCDEAAGASGTDRAGGERPSRLFQATVVLLLLVPLCTVLGWAGLLLVVGEQVVPGWLLGAGLLVASVVLLTVDVIRRRSISPLKVLPKRGLVTSLAVISVISSGFSALDDLSSAKYFVLSPANSDGCRVAVREFSFLFAGRGTVYVVGETGVGRKVSSWTADDGYKPFSSGTYELRWYTDEGSLRIDSNRDPVWPALHEIRC